MHGPLTMYCMKLKQVNKPRKEPDKVTPIDSMQIFPVTFFANLVTFVSKAFLKDSMRVYEDKSITEFNILSVHDVKVLCCFSQLQLIIRPSRVCYKYSLIIRTVAP